MSLYYRQYPPSLWGYTYNQCLMDCIASGGQDDYEWISPYQSHLRSIPNYGYNPYSTMYSSYPINRDSNNSTSEIGTEFLGVVQNRRFRILYPQSDSGFTKLTEDSMSVGRPIIELKLEDYEGKAMLVSGDYRGDWIYQVKIIEEAGPILTILTKQLFNVTNNGV